MKSTVNWLSVLMDNYKVLLYNGQLDLIVGGPLTERFLQVLSWSGQKDYLQAERKVWKIGDDVAGYVRQVGKFMQVRLSKCEDEGPTNTMNLIITFNTDLYNHQGY